MVNRKANIGLIAVLILAALVVGYFGLKQAGSPVSGTIFPEDSTKKGNVAWDSAFPGQDCPLPNSILMSYRPIEQYTYTNGTSFNFDPSNPESCVSSLSPRYQTGTVCTQMWASMLQTCLNQGGYYVTSCGGSVKPCGSRASGVTGCCEVSSPTYTTIDCGAYKQSLTPIYNVQVANKLKQYGVMDYSGKKYCILLADQFECPIGQHPVMVNPHPSGQPYDKEGYAVTFTDRTDCVADTQPTTTTITVTPPPAINFLSLEWIAKIKDDVWAFLKGLFGFSIIGQASYAPNAQATFTISIPTSGSDPDYSDGTRNVRYGLWYVLDSTQTVQQTGQFESVTGDSWSKSVTITTPSKTGSYYLIADVVNYDQTYLVNDTWETVGPTLLNREAFSFKTEIAPAPMVTPPAPSNWLSSVLSAVWTFLKGIFGAK